MNKIKLWTFKKHLLLSLTIVIIVTFLGMLLSAEASSIGIIGGADGPTVIYLTSNPSILFVLAKVVLLAILLVLYKPLKKIVKKQ